MYFSLRSLRLIVVPKGECYFALHNPFYLGGHMKSVVSVLMLIMFMGVQEAGATMYREPRPVVPGLINWLDAWRKGQKTNATLLEGRWKLIGRAASEKCSFLGRDAFDVRGLRSFERGMPILEFEELEVPGFVRKMFVVKMHNFGGRFEDQGPYEVLEQEPQFSFWRYDRNGTASTNEYLEYSCRLYESNLDWMICLVTMKAKIPSNTDAASLACSEDKPGIVYVFSKTGLPAPLAIE